MQDYATSKVADMRRHLDRLARTANQADEAWFRELGIHLQRLVNLKSATNYDETQKYASQIAQ
ncbi:MAG: hypothetical protein ACK51A_00410 [Sphingobacteriia bacterium]